MRVTFKAWVILSYFIIFHLFIEAFHHNHCGMLEEPWSNPNLKLGASAERWLLSQSFQLRLGGLTTSSSCSWPNFCHLLWSTVDRSRKVSHGSGEANNLNIPEASLPFMIGISDGFPICLKFPAGGFFLRIASAETLSRSETELVPLDSLDR